MLDLEACGIAFKVKFVNDIPLNRSGKLMAVVSKLKTNL